MFTFRKLLAVLPAISITLMGAAPLKQHRQVAQLPRPHRPAVVVAMITPTIVAINGRLNAVPSVRNATRLMVALEPIANGLGVSYKRSGAALTMQVNDSWIDITPDDVMVREGPVPMMRLVTAPARRAGKTFVDADDVSTILDVEATRVGNRLTVSRKDSKTSAGTSSGFTVRELATPKPTPSASPTPMPARSFDEVPAGKRLIGHASFNMNNDAYNRYYAASFDGGTQNVRASFYANGASGGRTDLGGSLRVGGGNKHVTVGGISDPLSGDLFSGAGSSGFEIENAQGYTAAWGNSTIGDRHTVALGRRMQSSNAVFAFATQYGGGMQPLLGFQQWQNTTSGYFGREVWVGTHGIGADVHYRTAGRMYAEAKVGFAGAGLPLVLGDNASRLDVGYDFNKAFGMRTGFTEGHGLHPEPMLEMYGKLHGVQLSAQRYGSQNLLSAVLPGETNAGYVTYGFGPAISQLSANFLFSTQHGAIETTDYISPGASYDLMADYRLKREGPALQLGVETVRSGAQGRFGPVLGYSAPLLSGLNAGIQFHPLVRGNALRFTVQQALFASSGPRQHFVNVGALTPSSSPLFVAIDGARAMALSSNGMQIGIPAGNHYISLHSDDGTLASPEQRVTEGGATTFSLPLWPVRSIRGRVIIPKNVAAILQTVPPLGAITVLLEPGDIAALTEDDGTFAFPAQAVSPDATIVVDADSLPDSLAPAEAQKAPQDGAITIELRSSKKIEKVVF